jgi:stage V sporulation protein D (sporulation-specific penicillin-binding protein)
MERNQRGTFYDYIKDFGFGSRTGIDLMGEAVGIMVPQANLRPVNIATISIGQGIAVTSIQLVTAMSAIANEGVLLRPHLVREILDVDGNVIERIEPEAVRQVISRETAQEILYMLEASVTDGTGRNAYIAGYRVGGKTGTAQKAGPGGYIPGKFIASFLGVAPIDDPRLVVLVIVDEPQGYPHYGGTLAAPIFRRVVEDSLHYLGVAPQHNSNGTTQSSLQQTDVPDITGLSIDRAERALRNRGLIAEFRGSGTVVASQNPEALTQVNPGTRVIVQLEAGDVGDTIRIPDLSGLRIHQAANLLEAMGLRIIPEGTGRVVAQYPEPTAELEPGRAVRVVFQE